MNHDEEPKATASSPDQEIWTRIACMAIAVRSGERHKFTAEALEALRGRLRETVDRWLDDRAADVRAAATRTETPAFSASVLRFPRIDGRIALDTASAYAIANLLERVRALRHAEAVIASPHVRGLLGLLYGVFVADEQLERAELGTVRALTGGGSPS